MQECQTISLSDTNVNTNIIDKDPHQIHTQDRKTIPILRALQDKIFNSGACFIKTENTRYNWLTKCEDTIEHCIMNTPQNIVSHTVYKTGESDHNILQFTVKTTISPTHPRYFITRDYKSVKWDEMKTAISNDPQLTEASLSDNTHSIWKSIQEIVTSHLDAQAPLKKHQTKVKTSILHFP